MGENDRENEKVNDGDGRVDKKKGENSATKKRIEQKGMKLVKKEELVIEERMIKKRREKLTMKISKTK